jgi:hypothetical protein
MATGGFRGSIPGFGVRSASGRRLGLDGITSRKRPLSQVLSTGCVAGQTASACPYYARFTLTRTHLRELREIIEKARVILNTTSIPDGRAGHAKELIAQAVIIARHREGRSIRTVERLTGIRRDSIIDPLLFAGERCEKLLDSLPKKKTKGRKTPVTMKPAIAMTGSRLIAPRSCLRMPSNFRCIRSTPMDSALSSEMFLECLARTVMDDDVAPSRSGRLWAESESGGFDSGVHGCP